MARQKNGISRRAMLAAAGAASVSAVVSPALGSDEKQEFKANACTFEEGVAIVKKAVEARHMAVNDRIVTSRDKVMKELATDLKCKNVPEGFHKWQLPVIFDKAQLYISVADAHSKVPVHSHDEGAGIRVMISGSIHYGDHELTAGDWMYIPKGKKYSFEVGPLGATMFYCYECCCK